MGTYQELYASNFFTDDVDQIKKKSQELINKYMGLIMKSDYKEMNHLLDEVKPMRYSAQGYLENCNVTDREKDVLVNVGYNSAVMDAMQLYLGQLYEREEIQKIKTRYRDVVLSILAKRGTLLHKDLATEIGVSASGLTAVIKQINASSVKLVNIDEVSKFKLYSLTPVAYKYISQYLPDKPKDYRMNIRKEYFIYDEEKIDVNERRYDEEKLNIDLNENRYEEKEEILLETPREMGRKTSKYVSNGVMIDFYKSFKQKRA